jgi:hypothetical protein
LFRSEGCGDVNVNVVVNAEKQVSSDDLVHVAVAVAVHVDVVNAHVSRATPRAVS